jgi:predicted anti-sigma-YlaC factor YlaD
VIIRDYQCDRARAWTSLRVDGELSEHESALLEGHLRRCLGCRAFSDQVELATSALRSTAQVDRPRELTVSGPVRRTRGGTSLAALAAVVAATAVGVVIGFRHTVEGTGFSSTAEAIADPAPVNGAGGGNVAGIPIVGSNTAATSSDDRSTHPAAPAQRMP